MRTWERSLARGSFQAGGIPKTIFRVLQVTGILKYLVQIPHYNIMLLEGYCHTWSNHSSFSRNIQKGWPLVILEWPSRASWVQSSHLPQLHEPCSMKIGAGAQKALS